MVEAILHDTKEVMPICAYVDGPYDIHDVYVGVPARLGADGIEEIVEFDLNAEELETLQASAASCAKQLDDLNLRG